MKIANTTELLLPIRVATTSLNVPGATHAGGAVEADSEYLFTCSSEIALLPIVGYEINLEGI